MKKIGILTINGYFNYGNRLQNLALQEILMSLGFIVETLRIKVNSSGMKEKKSLRSVTRKIYYSIRRKKKIEEIDVFRSEKFKLFTKKYIYESEDEIDIDLIPMDLKDKYDYFVAGSDQVWSPFYFGNPRIYFMGFADEKQRVSYAASFGCDSIPEKLIEVYKNGLKGIKKCSVREDSAVNIVKSLSNISPELVLDPTLLLKKEEWEKYYNKNEAIINEKYILVYFLGNKTEEYLTFINKISTKYQLKIVDLLDKKVKYYNSDPSDFLNYIANAELVCTDSFHGTVFSIVFKKNFVTFKKASKEVSMFSRLTTLLSMMEMENRIYGAVDPDKLFSTDYSGKEELIQREREKSICFLKKALEVSAND